MSALHVSVGTGRRCLAVVGFGAWLVAALIAPLTPTASADCTTAGDFGAGAGCAPPGGGGSSAQAWPPTAVDWPPGGDADSGGKGGGEHSGADDASPAPIVMPDGQETPKAKTQPTAPIVPAGPPGPVQTVTTATTATVATPPIVMPDPAH